jgi:spore germination protein GerM
MKDFTGRRVLGVMAILLIAGGIYWYWPRAKKSVEEPGSLPEQEVTIYLLDRKQYRLTTVKRQVPEAKGQSARIKQIIQELRLEPNSPELVRLVPKKLTLRSAYVDGQTVYLDFNDELVGAARGSTGEMMLLYSIVNSVLKNLPDKYKLVQFLIEGEQRKTIGAYGEDSGHIAIQYPLGPRWNLADTSS